MMNFLPSGRALKLFSTLIAVLLLALIAFVGSEAINSIREGDLIGDPEPTENLITVNGEAKVSAAPDIAIVTMGIESKAETVGEAQENNTELMNELIKAVKKLSIDEEDIKTKNYNVYENKSWNPETRVQDSLGWIVSQSIEVKVRDTDAVASVLSLAGDKGVTNISGPNFTIDDTGIYLDQAREKAIENARKNAEAIAKALDLKLAEIVNYNEWFTSDNEMPYYAYGMGGAITEDAKIAPTIQAGTEEMELNVNVTYRLSK